AGPGLFGARYRAGCALAVVVGRNREDVLEPLHVGDQIEDVTLNARGKGLDDVQHHWLRRRARENPPLSGRRARREKVGPALAGQSVEPAALEAELEKEVCLGANLVLGMTGDLDEVRSTDGEHSVKRRRHRRGPGAPGQVLKQPGDASAVRGLERGVD